MAAEADETDARTLRAMAMTAADRGMRRYAPAAESVRSGARRARIVRFARGKAWLPPAVSAAVSLSLHAAALYAVLHGAEPRPPAVSVPLTISLGTASEPMPATRRPAPPQPKPRPRQPPPQAATPAALPAPAPEPAAPELPAEAASTHTPPAAEQPAPPAVRAPRFDAAYLNNPVPAYPPLSRRLGEQGRVLLRVYVRPDGRAREVHVYASSGHTRLDRAAREAVEHWQFLPARRGDEPVGAWVLVPVFFTLKQG
jgi:protein TonB